MHYLIDGHNLIAKLPDVDLADPDDEIELIIRLRNWAAGSKRRQATVVFDRGAIGGVAHRLSSREITVIFASPGKTADDLLIRRLRSLKNPKRYTLVSSDREIIDAARQTRIKFMRSETFIQRMGLAPKMPPEEEMEADEPEPKPDPRLDPKLSEEEIQEWLDLFGPAPERKKRPSPSLPDRRRKPSTPKEKSEKKKAPPRRPRTPEEFIVNAQSEDPHLDEAEIAEWMELFGPAPERSPEEKKASEKKRRSLTKKGKKKKKKKPGRLPTLKEGERKLSEEEVDAWLELFEEGE